MFYHINEKGVQHGSTVSEKFTWISYLFWGFSYVIYGEPSGHFSVDFGYTYKVIN